MTTAPQQRALITGAAFRIGRAIALDLAAHGFDVVLHANRSADAARDLAQKLRDEHGVRTAVVTADLSDADDVERVIPEAAAALGPLTLLVNNASLFSTDEADDVQSALFRRHMAINAEAPAILSRAFKAQTDGGLIVNMIDQRVWKPTPRYFSYGASKSALWWLTRTLAQAYAPSVRVNALGPGPVLKAASQTQDAFDALVEAVPLQRAPDPAEFGQAIRFLVAARSITGQMLAIDAGQHLSWQTPDATVPE